MIEKKNIDATKNTKTSVVARAAATILCFLCGAIFGYMLNAGVVLGIGSGLRLLVGVNHHRQSFIGDTIHLALALAVFSASVFLLSWHLRRVGRNHIVNVRCGFLFGLTTVSSMATVFFLWFAFSTAFTEGDAILPIEHLQRAYIALEGPDARGPYFEQLALTLDGEITEAQLIEYLGLPDLVKEDKQSKKFAYFYDRFGQKDWVVYVDFTANDPFASFGYNAASVIDHSDWKPYEAE